jgi:hypothetical protein
MRRKKPGKKWLLVRGNFSSNSSRFASTKSSESNEKGVWKMRSRCTYTRLIFIASIQMVVAFESTFMIRLRLYVTESGEERINSGTRNENGDELNISSIWWICTCVCACALEMTLFMLDYYWWLCCCSQSGIFSGDNTNFMEEQKAKKRGSRWWWWRRREEEKEEDDDFVAEGINICKLQFMPRHKLMPCLFVSFYHRRLSKTWTFATFHPFLTLSTHENCLLIEKSIFYVYF